MLNTTKESSTPFILVISLSTLPYPWLDYIVNANWIIFLVIQQEYHQRKQHSLYPCNIHLYPTLSLTILYNNTYWIVFWVIQQEYHQRKQYFLYPCDIPVYPTLSLIRLYSKHILNNIPSNTTRIPPKKAALPLALWTWKKNLNKNNDYNIFCIPESFNTNIWYHFSTTNSLSEFTTRTLKFKGLFCTEKLVLIAGVKDPWYMYNCYVKFIKNNIAVAQDYDCFYHL